MTKSINCLFLLFVLSCGVISLIFTNCVKVSADSNEMSKPSVPEFTLRLVAHPYDEPPTNTTLIDQYTGEETVITTPGYHVENKSIEVVIENQAFTPYTDEDGHEINLYYDVRFKGHFGDDWQEHYSIDVVWLDGHYGYVSQSPVQSNSEFTVVSLSVDFPEGAQVDYQVRAHLGYPIEYYPYNMLKMVFLFQDEFSDWSSIQTFTFEENTEIPEFPSWIILPLVLTITLFSIFVKRKLHNAKAS